MTPPTTPAKKTRLIDIALATPPPPAKRGGIKAASDEARAGLQPKIKSKEGEIIQPCVEHALSGNIRTSLRIKTAGGKTLWTEVTQKQSPNHHAIILQIQDAVKEGRVISKSGAIEMKYVLLGS